VVLEGRHYVLVAIRQGEARLYSEQAVRADLCRRTRALRMRYAVACDHPVQLAWPYDRVRTRAVPVMEATSIEVGHGAKTDMRMGSNVDALPGGTGLTEEYERADHLAIGRR